MAPENTKDLTIRLRKRADSTGKALDVDIRVSGGNLCLFGDADSGRSEVLRCIAGLDKPDEGRIALGDRVLFDSMEGSCLPPALRRVGYLAEGAGLFSRLTVSENLRLALSGGGREAGSSPEKHALKEAEDSILRDFGLDGLGGLLPEHLSKSQTVLALFARMLAAKPSLVLLDNPFRDLGGYEKADILEKIREKLTKERIPWIFAGNDRDEIYAMGDLVCVLHEGKSEGTKKRDAFFQSPETLAGAILSGCENLAPVTRLDAFHVTVPDWGQVLCFRRTEGQAQKDTEEEKTKGEPDPAKAEEKSGAVKAQEKTAHGEAERGLVLRRNEGEDIALWRPPGERWKELPKDIAAVGIRAEDFLLKEPEEGSAYLALPVRDRKIREERSTLDLAFLPGAQAKKPLHLRMQKSEMNKNELNSVEKVYISENKILWLRD